MKDTPAIERFRSKFINPNIKIYPTNARRSEVLYIDELESFISSEIERAREELEIDWVSCKSIPARHSLKLHLKKCLGGSK